LEVLRWKTYSRTTEGLRQNAMNTAYDFIFIIQRLEESDTKMRSVIDITIGDRIGNMILINLLATEPASQGRGYGGSLVEAVNDIV
jgi:hypothetical protein